MSTERWLPVPGYEGRYEVSSHGSIHSLLNSSGRRLDPPRILRPYVQERGHLRIDFWRDGSRKGFLVHHLVLAAFREPRPGGLVTRHLDGDPANNWIENLTWGTYAENSADAVRHGTHVQARKTHCPRGHGYVTTNAQRVCRTCANEGARRRRAAAKEMAA